MRSLLAPQMGPELTNEQRHPRVGLGPSEDLGSSDGQGKGDGEGVCAGVSGAGGSFPLF